MPYEVRTEQNGPIVKFTACDYDHRPSWKTTGGGFAELKVQSHTANPYLSITATEVSEGGKSSRCTMVTLDADEGRSLYEFLAARYNPTPEVARG